MSSPICSMASVLTFSLLSAPSLRAQGKGKPAPEEQTGLELGANLEGVIRAKLFLEGYRERRTTEALMSAAKIIN